MWHSLGQGRSSDRYTYPAGTVFVREINRQTTLKQRKSKDNEKQRTERFRKRMSGGAVEAKHDGVDCDQTRSPKTDHSESGNAK